jgi:hypothetical protein
MKSFYYNDETGKTRLVVRETTGGATVEVAGERLLMRSPDDWAALTLHVRERDQALCEQLLQGQQIYNERKSAMEADSFPEALALMLAALLQHGGIVKGLKVGLKSMFRFHSRK